MTRNYLEYLTLLETRRDNMARLVETVRHNKEMERYNSGMWRETKRSNRANEEIKSAQNDETIRSNLARESEQHRTNVAREGLDLLDVNESIRHNQVTEELTKTHNANQSTYWMGSLANDKYRTDKQYQANIYASNANVKAAGINAAASRYAADQHREASKYGADLSYASSVYGADSATKRTMISEYSDIFQMYGNQKHDSSEREKDRQNQLEITDKNNWNKTFNTVIGMGGRVAESFIDSGLVGALSGLVK